MRFLADMGIANGSSNGCVPRDMMPFTFAMKGCSGCPTAEYSKRRQPKRESC